MPAPLDPDLKAKLVAEAELGKGVREIARTYGVDHGTVSRAIDQARAAAGVVSPRSASLYEKTVETIGQMIVNQGLILQRQHERLMDDDWVQRQSGRDFAAMAGTGSKEIRGWMEFAQRHTSGHLSTTSEDTLAGGDVQLDTYE